MDVNNLTSLPPVPQQNGTPDIISTIVLKKALDSQASSASALLAALPPVTSANLPMHLGQTVNTVA
jgi:hypothetical protein